MLQLCTFALAFSGPTQRATRPLLLQGDPLSRQGMPHMLLPELASTVCWPEPFSLSCAVPSELVVLAIFLGAAAGAAAGVAAFDFSKRISDLKTDLKTDLNELKMDTGKVNNVLSFQSSIGRRPPPTAHTPHTDDAACLQAPAS